MDDVAQLPGERIAAKLYRVGSERAQDRCSAPSHLADTFKGNHAMATDIFPATVPGAEEESAQAT
jgi:hypothetical protein